MSVRFLFGIFKNYYCLSVHSKCSSWFSDCISALDKLAYRQRGRLKTDIFCVCQLWSTVFHISAHLHAPFFLAPFSHVIEFIFKYIKVIEPWTIDLFLCSDYHKSSILFQCQSGIFLTGQFLSHNLSQPSQPSHTKNIKWPI